jgi:hypothetical protein
MNRRSWRASKGRCSFTGSHVALMFATMAAACCSRSVCSSDSAHSTAAGRVCGLSGGDGCAGEYLHASRLRGARASALQKARAAHALQALRGGNPAAYAPSDGDVGMLTPTQTRRSGFSAVGSTSPARSASASKPSRIKPLGDSIPTPKTKRGGDGSTPSRRSGWEGRMHGDTRKGGVVGRHLSGATHMSPTKVERLVGAVSTQGRHGHVVGEGIFTLGAGALCLCLHLPPPEP